MEKITFKSVAQDNVRYVIAKDHYDMPNSNFYHQPSNYVGNTCFQYDTYGDGEVQHSPEYLVSATQIEDFMVSLALYISNNHSSELLSVLDNLTPFGISTDQITFLYNLKAGSNGKPTYINLQDMKKTTSDKQYDKRWKKLPEDYRPDFKHIYPYFIESYHGFLTRLIIAEKIREATHWNIWLDYEESFKIPNFSNIRDAIRVLESFTHAYKEIDFISRAAGCIKNNMHIDD